MARKTATGSKKKKSVWKFLSIGIFDLFFWFFSISSSVGLLLSYWGGNTSPSELWILGVFALLYPVFLIFQLICILYWLIRTKWYALIFFFIILIGYPNILNSIRIYRSNSMEESEATKIKVMSFNVRAFNLYNWNSDTTTKSSIFDFMHNETPDILCIQEFYSRQNSNQDYIDSVKDAVGSRIAHAYYSEIQDNGQQWGMVTLSKYPILKKGKIDFYERTSNSAIYSDIKVNSDTIRVFNIHMESVRLDNKDYAYINQVKEEKQKAGIEGAEFILKRLKKAFNKRGKQVDLILTAIKSSPYKVIVCGDFNDTPYSYTYKSLNKILKDAFIQSGIGIGATYNGAIPSLRIDYILHDPKLNSYMFNVHKGQYSDHFPISTYIQFTNPTITE